MILTGKLNKECVTNVQIQLADCRRSVIILRKQAIEVMNYEEQVRQLAQEIIEKVFNAREILNDIKSIHCDTTKEATDFSDTASSSLSSSTTDLCTSTSSFHSRNTSTDTRSTLQNQTDDKLQVQCQLAVFVLKPTTKQLDLKIDTSAAPPQSN
ncbi:hypothetical protein M3Y97_00079400 [Aphelenchoides bicaudatus]|nr:hypothetical protein M3Y97_00079400 [Aphelenchoides bicaudatus]